MDTRERKKEKSLSIIKAKNTKKNKRQLMSSRSFLLRSLYAINERKKARRIFPKTMMTEVYVSS